MHDSDTFQCVICVKRVMNLIITLDLARSCLACGAHSEPLQQKWAAAMLALLIEQGLRGRALDGPTLLEDCVRRGEAVKPDRTGIRRALLAIRTALDALGAGLGARIECPARAATVGPWLLRIEPGEVWRVQGDAAHSARAKALPQLADAGGQMSNPMAAYQVASALAVADSLVGRGSYAEAADLLREQIRTLPLSAEARWLWQFRWIRAANRSGQAEAARALVGQLDRAALAPMGRVGQHFAAHLKFTEQWMHYTQHPDTVAHGLDLDALVQTIDPAPPTQLYALACNLQALALRRQLLRKIKDRAAPSLVQTGIQEAHLAFGAAYFWASLGDDHYHQQAFAVNYARFLHDLVRSQLTDNPQPALAWFRLAHTLVDRFDLPQDSAWDFIMLADLYLQSPDAQSLVQADALSWPAQLSPASAKFYDESLRLARDHGDVRQQVLALNQRAHYLVISADLGNLAATRSERDALMREHPQVAAQALSDGMQVV